MADIYTLMLLDEKTEQQTQKTGNSQPKMMLLRDQARKAGFTADVFNTIEITSTETWAELRATVSGFTVDDLQELK